MKVRFTPGVHELPKSIAIELIKLGLATPANPNESENALAKQEIEQRANDKGDVYRLHGG